MTIVRREVLVSSTVSPTTSGGERIVNTGPIYARQIWLDNGAGRELAKFGVTKEGSLYVAWLREHKKGSGLGGPTDEWRILYIDSNRDRTLEWAVTWHPETEVDPC